MKLNERIIEMVYVKGERRDQVAEELDLSTKVIKVMEREFLKKLVADYFERKHNK